jgi:hypothetical protein
VVELALLDSDLINYDSEFEMKAVNNTSRRHPRRQTHGTSTVVIALASRN